MINFAQNLARIRRQQGHDQQDLAGQFSLSFQVISKWETVQSLPDLDQLADSFPISTDALLGHTPLSRRTAQYGFKTKWVCLTAFSGMSYLNSCF